MRVLMVSKANVTASYRTKLAYLNRTPGLTVGLVVPSRWGKLPFEPMKEDASYPLYLWPIWFSGHNHLHRYPRIARVIREFRPDLIHLDEEHYSVVTWEITRIALRLGIPTLFFTWQNIYKRYPWPFSAMERLVLTSARAAIAGNQEALDVLRKKGFTAPARVIPQFGTDDEIFVPAEAAATRSRLGLEGTVAIGYVGRLIAEKGLDDLMAAAAPLLAQDPSVRLVLVGSGPWRVKGEQTASREGIAAQVVWVSWLASGEMPQLMNALDIVVLPSHTTASWKEQFGRVLTEAMATKTPVVGSSSGEIPAVIGDAGWIFPEGDIAELNRILEQLVKDPVERQRWGERGYQRVRRHFTQAAVAAATVSLYREILGARSPG